MKNDNPQNKLDPGFHNFIGKSLLFLSITIDMHPCTEKYIPRIIIM